MTLWPTADASRLRLGLAFVLLTYFIIYGTLLWATNGLPYVFDNNETFSSIVHARNMLTHGIGQTFGLTDESVGLTSESNPYLYTHQGNFPRFFALLIYWLGARSAEAQIIVTTFTVGTAAICFAYDVIARRAGAAIGVLFCILMMTDYIMVAQWQVNTWRVWHMFFFFLSLLCVDRAATTDRPQPWLVLLLITHAALFYFELVFATFTAATTGFFAILTFRYRLRLIITSIAAQTAGMLLGIGILIAQLWAYFGWDDFVTDIKLTFLARNESMGAGSRAAAEQFMTEHKIAFWYNINEAVGLRHPSVMLEKFFALTLGVSTPALGAVAAIVTFGVLIYCLTHTHATSRFLDGTSVRKKMAQVIVGSLFFAYAILVTAGMGTGPGAESSGSVEVIVLVLASLILTNNLINHIYERAVEGKISLGVAASPIMVIILAILWLLATERVYASPTSYGENLSSIWSAAAAWTGPLPLQVMILFAGYAAARISTGNFSQTALTTVNHLSRLFTILVAGFLAYAVVYLLSPGYIITGYLNRFVPFVTFVNLIPFAIAICAIFAVAYGDMTSLRQKPWWRALWHPPRGRVRVRPLATMMLKESSILLVTAVATATLPYYWTMLQSTYLERLPPDQFDFLSLLKEPPFKGASFAANTYAAPIAVATGQWAYYDSLLGERRLKSDGSQVQITRDLRYLWLSDRDTNPTYLQPDYFLCIAAQHIGTAIRPSTRIMNGCSTLPLVSTAGKTIPGLLTTELIARDNTPSDRWAIVRLDWHRPASEASDKSLPPKPAEKGELQ